MEIWYVSMTDKFMSGWGCAKGMRNRLVILCATLAQAEQIQSVANTRPEMRRVTISNNAPRSRSGVLLTFKYWADLGEVWTGPLLTITEKMFISATGNQPVNDDLERVNCRWAGTDRHRMCGWNREANLPVFMAGPEKSD
jgi:hypothetical protein